MVVMMQFDARGRQIVCNVGNVAVRPLRVIDVESGRVQTISEEIGTFQQVDFSRDGRYMAGVSAAAVVVWDTRTWKEFRRFDGRFAPRSYAAFSRDGSHVATTDAE